MSRKRYISPEEIDYNAEQIMQTWEEHEESIENAIAAKVDDRLDEEYERLNSSDIDTYILPEQISSKLKSRALRKLKIKLSVKKMLKMQDTLNKGTAGEYWANGTTSTNIVINWRSCIIAESGELLDWHGYKHWSKQEPNIQELKIEVVDIWHFLMSLLISISKEDFDAIATQISDGFNIDIEDDVEYNLEEVLFKFIISIQPHSDIIIKSSHWFSALSRTAGISFDELYSMYMIKNWLNKFRQDNGYKDGSYIKKWNFDGKIEEDNTILFNMFEKLGEESFDLFSKKYKEMIDACK